LDLTYLSSTSGKFVAPITTIPSDLSNLSEEFRYLQVNFNIDNQQNVTVCTQCLW